MRICICASFSADFAAEVESSRILNQNNSDHNPILEAPVAHAKFQKSMLSISDHVQN